MADCTLPRVLTAASAAWARRLRRIGTLLLIVALLLPPAPGHAQSISPLPTVTPTGAPPRDPSAADAAAVRAQQDQVETILAGMSVADRVGQLFVIGFVGGSVGFDSDIAELIYGYRVGGVVLSSRNGNFANERGMDTPTQVATLINRLQAMAFGLLLPADRALDPVTEGAWPPPGSLSLEQMTTVPPVNLPLLVAVEQGGDGLPMTGLRRGFTPLPSQMALGATWNPELVYRVGQVVGRELAAVGVNLLLGPNLDVLEQPRTDLNGVLGMQSFGGDPDWVSQLGRAYIAGVHVGSRRQVATIARHFPGAGDADRLPDQEVATVQRALADMERVTLPPFFAVTRGRSTVLHSDGDPAVTEGVMTGHVRYSGVQGPSLGRNTPISLAPELQGLLTRAEFSEWRGQGGLVMSNMLGAPAIRRYYDPTLTEFPSRRVAMDAFTAGHDLLYLDRFSLDESWESQKQNIKETIGFFQERYVRDPDFAAQVDDAVRRIIGLKLRLYPAPAEGVTPPATDPTVPAPPVALATVLVNQDDLATLRGDAQAEALIIMGQVARESFTLLHPDPALAAEMAALSPQPTDRLLIVSDSRLLRECATCVAEAAVGPDELAAIITRLYGPTGTGQLTTEQVTSLTFTDLAQALAGLPAAPSADALPTPTPTPVPLPDSGLSVEDEGGTDQDKNSKTLQAIDEATWIIFAMLDVDGSVAGSAVVKDFLRQLGAQVASKRIVVLALHAPYYLDATEISKLNGYYGVYGKTQPFLESAVRALFRAYTPSGAPPVSVPGTRFASLAERLSPDPSRPIDLLVLAGSGGILAGEATSAGAPLPVVEAGTLIRIQAGPLYDYNGRPVRNGTPVEVVIGYEDDPAAREVETVTTQNGVAARDVVISRGGVAQITARAGDAVSTELVALSVQADAAARATSPAEVSPTPAAVAAVISPSVSVGEVDAAAAIPARTGLSPASLAVALLTMLATLSLLVVVQVRVLPRQTLVHSLLWAVNCGLAGYILYGLGLLPGGAWLQESLRVWGAGLVVFIAMLPPLVWLQLRAPE